MKNVAQKKFKFANYWASKIQTSRLKISFSDDDDNDSATDILYFNRISQYVDILSPDSVLSDERIRRLCDYARFAKELNVQFPTQFTC